MSDLPHNPTVFIDRNSGGHIFKAALIAAGIPVVLHDEYFDDPTTADEVWVEVIGKLDWFIVTGDAATIKVPLFLENLARSKARVFILDGLNGASAEGKALCIINAYPTMKKIAAQREPPSFWRFNKMG